VGKDVPDGLASIFSPGKMESAGNTLCISEHFHEAWGKKTPPDSGVGFDRKLYSKRSLSVKRFDQ